jgi:predicted nucleic acid-binding protein
VIFIDARAFIGQHVRRDPYHRQAVAAWERIFQTREPCLTSNFVLNEAFTFIARQVGYRIAAERARNIYASRQLSIVRPQQEDEIAALEFFEKYADQKVSFTDCVSFVLMRKNKLRRVFTFDHHFALAGFTMFP